MSDPPAALIVVAGPAGAGKTTVGRLVAAAFDPSAHIETDVFMPFVVKGRVEPWLPEAAHQNHVRGGAVAAAAFQFALGGYTVVLDGHIFPEGLDGPDGLTAWAERRGVPLHYAVLRPDLDTCLTRMERRRSGDAHDVELLARLHHRYSELGYHETHVVDASRPATEVAATIVTAVSAGQLRLVTPSSP